MSAIGPGETHDLSIYADRLLGVSEGDLQPATVGAIGAELRAIGDAVEEVIFSVWPVDTGRSLRAWRVFVDGLDLVIENPVFYSSWVHPAGTAGTMTHDELGQSAKAVRTERDVLWGQRVGGIRRIIEADGELAGPVGGSLLGNLTRAAIQKQLRRAATPDLPGSSIFTSLRDVFTLSSIAERERTRGRQRRRDRPRRR